MNKIEIESIITKYEEYLNNGQEKPQWRIDEVKSFINVMKKVLENGTD